MKGNKPSSLKSLFRFDLLTLVLLVACAAVFLARQETQRERVRLEQDLERYEKLESQLDNLLLRMNREAEP